MNAQEVAYVAALCRALAGLKVESDKTYLIESRLAPVARRESFPSVSELLAAIRSKKDEPLVWATVEAMAAGESSFFRDRTPFAEFRDEIAPQLARARAGQPIKVWSAACATGQEIYSLAMIAHDLAERGGPRIELAASDLSRLALERAQGGLYNQFEVQRGLPIRLLARHFEKEGDQWRLAVEIRKMVRWRRINLIAGLSRIGRFDVVFCRNVLGQMTADAQKKVVGELAGMIPADGYLVVGLGEDIPSLADAFQPIVGRAGLFQPRAHTPAAAVAA
jgi:chemotaxis protein methyltransferase CheR